MKIIIFVSVLLATISAQTTDQGNGESLSDLRKAIFQNYDKLVRPVKKASDAVKVRANLSPIAVKDVDVLYKIVKMDTWLFISWENEFLTWDPSQYGGIQEIRIDPSQVWTPDITLLSGTPDTNVVPPSVTNVFMYHNGTTLWVLPFTINTHCDAAQVRGQTFQCTAQLGSWTYNSHMLDLMPYPEAIRENPLHTYYETHPYWSLESVDVTRELFSYRCTAFCDEMYAVLKFKMTYKKLKEEEDGSDSSSSEDDEDEDDSKDKSKNDSKDDSKDKSEDDRSMKKDKKKKKKGKKD